ncbi:MAG: hypothetical protein J6P46_05390 [Bacteroidales bacterium]|nr:hypothetical protein [Bacteroidales bacterium]
MDAHLVLFRDGAPVITVQTGERWHVSTDTDMHRIVQGHLYTDYSSAEATWIGRDGTELFHYEGREMMAGFLVREEGVWTLGLDRSDGQGLSLRRDGKVVFEDPDGLLPPGADNPAFPGGLLHEDEGALYFFYYKDSADGREWYQVRDGIPEILPLEKELSAIFDVRRLKGRNIIVSEKKSWGLIGLLFRGDEPIVMHIDGGSKIRWAWLTGIDGADYFIKGELYASQSVRPSLWRADGSLLGIGWNEKILDSQANPDHSAWIYANSQGAAIAYMLDGEKVQLEAPCRYVTPRCSQLQGKHFLLALTPTDRSQQPYILLDGQRQTYHLNGFLTGLAYE